MSEQRLEYKGYQGSVEVSLEDNVLHGKLLHIVDLVTFEAKTPDGLRQAFETQVDEYLIFCGEEGIGGRIMTYEERTKIAMDMSLEELIFSYHWAMDTAGNRLKTIERLAARCDELEQRPANKETWAFCPECGSTDTENESGTYKQCAECGQDWYIDINYSVVIKEKLQMGRSLESELRSHKSAIDGMQDELDKVKAGRDAQIDEVEQLYRLKARWQAEALESVSMQYSPDSLHRNWLREEAAEIRRES